MRIESRCVVRGAWFAPLVLLASAAAAHSQSLERRIADAPDGEVRLTFTARPGVRGDGAGRISWQCGDGRCNHNVTRGRPGDRAACEEGPVRVRVTKRDGAVVDLDTYVGGDWSAPAAGRATDLGVVAAPDAAAWLLSFARRDGTRAGTAAILPALLADSVTAWPTLLEIAQDRDVPERTRKDAVFWVGQAAEQAATEGLVEIVDRPEGERAVQESAVFALSQRPRDEAVPVLIRVARTHRDPEIRRKAIFWLGQSNDPRALAYFEDVLTRP
jgi:hypothetical protein